MLNSTNLVIKTKPTPHFNLTFLCLSPAIWNNQDGRYPRPGELQVWSWRGHRHCQEHPFFPEEQCHEGRPHLLAVQRYDMRWSRSDHVITLEVPDSSIFFTKYFYVKRLPHLLTLDTDLFLFLTQDKILTLNPRFEVQMLMSSHRKFHGSSTFF